MVRRSLGLTAVAVSLALAYTAQPLRGQATPKSAPATQTKTTPEKMPARSAAATDLSKMPLVGVTIVQLKPELVAEWLEFQKNEVIPTLQKGGVKQRTGLTTVIGPSFEYVFLTPLASFADRDGQSPIVKALGEDGARTYAQKNRRFIASQRTLVARMRTDLTYQPDPAAQAPMAVVSEYSLVPGHAGDFENYIKTDVTPAHKQLKTPGFLVYQGIFGGDGNTFVVATMVSNFADLDKGPAVSQAYGAARAASIQQKLSGIVAHVERTVSRTVPELTFRTRAVSER